jgi:hypothetical protein
MNIRLAPFGFGFSTPRGSARAPLRPVQMTSSAAAFPAAPGLLQRLAVCYEWQPPHRRLGCWTCIGQAHSGPSPGGGAPGLGETVDEAAATRDRGVAERQYLLVLGHRREALGGSLCRRRHRRSRNRVCRGRPGSGWQR